MHRFQSKGDDIEHKLGQTMHTWLQSRPDTAAAFSGAGLEPFFGTFLPPLFMYIEDWARYRGITR
jgi:hypothetical protein